MLELIKDLKDRKKADLNKLQSTELPIVMYGAGSYAVDVSRFLHKHNIKIDGYCIDAKYMLKTEQKNLSPLFALEELGDRFKQANIVIGFADYINARKKLESLSYVKDIFFIDAPNQEDFFDYSFIKSNKLKFEETYNWLQDKKSRDILIAFINAKICGDPTGLYKYGEFNQYFCDLIELSNKEVFVDCGAYDGDTIRNFYKESHGQYKRIYALEPDKENFHKLTTSIKNQALKNVKAYNLGAWSDKSELSFSSAGNVATFAEDGDIRVAVDSIDNLVQDDSVTYIKMDIEGSELEALKGAQNTIRRNKPKLAICAYHKPEDLITLPQYIKSLANDYQLYLRHHQFMSWEMVLYATIK